MIRAIAIILLSTSLLIGQDVPQAPAIDETYIMAEMGRLHVQVKNYAEVINVLQKRIQDLNAEITDLKTKIIKDTDPPK